MITEYDLLYEISKSHTDPKATSAETVRWLFYDAFGLLVDLEQIKEEKDELMIYIGDFRFSQNYDPQWYVELFCHECDKWTYLAAYVSDLFDLKSALKTNKHPCVDDIVVVIDKGQDKNHG